MTNSSYEDDMIFEDEVRRIARYLWPQSEFGGATIVRGRETDAVFETQECIHLIEATTSRTKAKAETDIKKLVSSADELRRKAGTKTIACWFVTQSEPTADQRLVLAKIKAPRAKVNVLSFRQFENQMIDASSYLSLRMNFPFGSVREPGTNEKTPKIEYIGLDLVNTTNNEVWDAKKVTDKLHEGGHFLILGDYGAGKSMTLREIFFELRKSFLKSQTPRFPMLINMRDHFGQTDPAEVLERHARKIGFANPSHLVRAWLAGYGILLIDGFDEVASLGVQGAWKKLRETRFRSMEVIRKFIRDTPAEVGIAIAGRPQFFDTDSERNTALALDGRFASLSVSEFTEQQVSEFLKRSGCKGNIPSWMPTRPLLVAYLIAKGLLSDVSDEGTSGKVQGWDKLIEKISGREAEIEAGIDGLTVRRILERLATKARSTQNGLGSLTPDQVVRAFEEICEYLPDDRAMVLLQRLPGLGVDVSGSENRCFIDADFADTCRAGDVARCVEDPYNFDINLFEPSECCLDELGVSVATLHLERAKSPAGKTLAALGHLSDKNADRTLLTDVVRIAGIQGVNIEQPTYLKDVSLNNWDLNSVKGNLSRVTFQDSYFGALEIDEEINPDLLPRFSSCLIGQIEGRTQKKDLPANVFDDGCLFDSFSETMSTTDDILELALPLGCKVLLTILKKLYTQRGRGRRETALRRGLDQRGQRLVPDILNMIENDGLATCYKIQGRPIWFPNRSQMARVGRMLSTPHECKDPVFVQAGKIS